MGEEVVEKDELTFFQPRDKSTTTRVYKRITSKWTQTSIEITTEDSIGVHRERT